MGKSREDLAMQPFDNLIPLDLNLVKTAALTGAAAFADDPYAKYVLPYKRDRVKLRFGFEYYLRISVLGKARSYVTSSACEGFAVWHDSLEKDPFRLLFRVNPLLPLRCGWRFVFRDASFNRFAAEIKRQYAPEHHMYLALLAVHPASQGKGFATRLLKPVLGELDRLNLPCYLETQTPKNVSMYEHFGFKNVFKALPPQAKLPFYGMLRK
jgi:GNAT superfamily N-acetyltransferase